MCCAVSKIVHLRNHLVRKKEQKPICDQEWQMNRSNSVAILNIESDITKALMHNDVVNEPSQLKSYK